MAADGDEDKLWREAKSKTRHYCYDLEYVYDRELIITAFIEWLIAVLSGQRPSYQLTLCMRRVYVSP